MAFVASAVEQPANDGEERRPEIATHRLESIVSKNTASRIPFFIGAIEQRGANGRMTRLYRLLLIASEAFWLLMIALGTLFRDAFLTFYWPWEARGMKIVAVNNLNLSEIFWQRTFASSVPDHPVLRESPGLVLIVVYCLATSICCWYILKLLISWRQAALCAVSQMALFFPFVILVKRVFAVKYLVSYPEIFFNV